MMSWVSFWINRNAVSARILLGVMSMLTMIALILFTNSQLPQVPYLKAIDIFLGTCLILIFLSLLEFATVGYVGKKIVDGQSDKVYEVKPSYLDKVSRVVLPVFFVLFNICYWIYYETVSKAEIEDLIPLSE